MIAKTDIDRRFLKGQDLAICNKKVAAEMSIRTLIMRRVNFSLLSSLIPHAHKLNEEHKMKVNPTDAIAILRSRNENQIAEFAERLAKLVQTDPRSAKTLANSEEVCDALFEALSEATSESLRQILIRAIQGLFPLLGDQQTVLIDNGLVSLCSDFLSLPTLSVVCDTADLIAVIARSSSWGRDTIICCGIQDILIDLVLHSNNETVCVKACAALAHIFEECDNNMTDISLSTAQNAMNLLQIESIPAMRWILDLLSNLSKANATVSFLLENSIHTLIVKFLEIEGLRRPVLTLLSRLLTGESFKVREVANAGILPLLFGLLGTEHTSQALIVLSTLAETIPDVFVPLVTPQMASEIVEMAQVANFDIRRECVFFLATLLQFLPPDALPPLITPQVMDELSEMCSCGNGKVVVRCLAGMIRVGMLSISSGRAQEFRNVMLTTEIVGRLEELGLCENKCVVKAALTLQSMLSE